MKARIFGLFFGILLAFSTVANVYAAGYVCDSIKYTSCGAGYYMTLSGSYNGSPQSGNACSTCPSAAEYCPGGTYAPAYKVILNANGGTGGTTAIYRVQNVGWFSSLKKSTTPATSLSGIGDPFSTLPSKPTRTGYTFNGFYDATSGGTQTITSAGVVSASNAYGTATWYAQWTATRYKITLNGNGAAAAPITGCTIDGNVSKAYYVYDTSNFVCETGNSTTLTSLPVPSRTGYKFKGYYSAASGGKQITDASGALINKNFTTTDMTIYAQWEPITFTVIYVANGGSGTQMENTKCTYDSDCYITKNTYTKTGYTFKNWADSDNSKTFSDGENVKNAKTTSGATLFLYAQWTAISKTCSAGQYFNVTECADCTSGYYCPDGSKTYTYDGNIQGRSTCPTIYTKSDTKATSSAKCYVTTTAGKYIANAKDSSQTNCDTNYYCPSTKVYYGSTGGKLACPTPTADNAPEMPSDYTVRSVIFADWLNINLTSMDQCRATFTFNNNKGVVTYEAVKYDTSTNKYGSSTTSIYWSKVNAGYYLYTRYSDDYCEKALAEGKSRSMIYRNVADCPIGSYCPGESWVPNCSSGTYENTYGKYACPENSWTNDGAGNAFCTCYTGYNYNGGTTTTSNACVANTYTIVYNSNGGSAVSNTSCTYGQTCTVSSITPTKTGYTFNGWLYNGKTYTSGQDVTNLVSTNGTTITFTAQWTAKSYTCGAGKYLDGTECKDCTSGYYCPGDTYTYNAGIQGRSTCPTIYNNSDAGASSNKQCYIITEAGKMIQYPSASTEAACSVNSYCVGGIKINYGSNGGSSACPANSSTNGATGQTKCTCNTGYNYNSGTTTASDACVANAYTIVYNSNGGSAVSSTSCTYGQTCTISGITPTKTGYTFYGWDIGGDTYAAGQSVSNLIDTNNGTVTLVAQWTANTYTIVYNPNGGSVVSSTLCTYGQTCTISNTVPTKTGYTFAGWNYASTTYQAGAGVSNLASANGDSVTFTAQWSTNARTCEPGKYLDGDDCKTCPVNSYCGGGTWEYNGDIQGLKKCPANSSTNGATGQTFCTCNAGYNYDNATETTSGACVGNDFTITYDLNGGSGNVQNTVCTNGNYCVVSTTKPTKKGYNFAGWLYNSKKYESGAPFSELISTNGETITFTAKWEPITYIIRYDADGGYGYMADTTCTYDQLCYLSENTYTKTGHRFVHWWVNDYAAGEYVDKAATQQNAIVIAKAYWLPIQIPCPAGQYLDGLDCRDCQNEYYCEGSEAEGWSNGWSYDGGIHGRKPCPEIDETYGAVGKDLLDVIANEPHKSIDECRATFVYAPQWYLDYLKEQGETTEDILAGYDPQANNRGMYYVSCDYNPETQQYDTNCTGVPMFCDAGYVSDTKKSIFDENINPDDILVYATSPQDAIEKTCVPVGRNNWSSSVKICMNLPDEEIMSCTLNATKVRNACPDGLRTVGYGKGADEENDCGRILHIGENVVYLRKDKRTTPSLNVRVDGVVYYGSMSKSAINMNDKSERKLRIFYNNTPYWVHDDTVL